MCIERIKYPTLRTRRDQGGITLIELIVFIVIVSVSVVGVLTVLNMTTAHSADPMIRKQMLAIAESLIEEVELQPFTVCDPSDATAATATTTAGCTSKIQGFGQPAGPVANRSLFNNVGNYCNEVGTGGVTCTSMTGAVGTAGYLGTAGLSTSYIPDLTALNPSPPGYSATINLYAEPLGGIASTSAAATMNVLRIQVTVSYYGSKESIVLEGYRTRSVPQSWY